MTRARRTSAMVFALEQVLVAHDPLPAIAAGVGEQQARAVLAADDFSFAGWSRTLDLGTPVDEAVAAVEAEHPHHAAAARSYVEHYPLSLTGQVDGSVWVLRELYDARVPLFALTNASSELFEAHVRPRLAFLEGFLDVVVSGAEGVATPDPAIFRVLEQRMGIPLTECCYTDAHPRHVLAGTACGLDAVRFEDPAGLRRALLARGAPLRPA